MKTSEELIKELDDMLSSLDSIHYPPILEGYEEPTEEEINELIAW